MKLSPERGGIIFFILPLSGGVRGGKITSIMKRIYNQKSIKSKRRKLRNNMPEPERRLWFYLRNRQIKETRFRRQCSIGPYIVDFYSFDKKLCIEVDGESHFDSEQARIYDLQRQRYLASHGIRVIRFNNLQIMNEIEFCILNIEQIIDEIHATCST